MPILGAPLDFAKLEGRNFRAHQLGTPPSSPVTGQLYYDTAANVLYYYNGSSWVSAAGGAPPDATPSVKGVVQLAGDLSGTAAAPVVANGAITAAKIADGTITDVDVAAANKDGAVATPSMRTLGFGASQAMRGNTSLDFITAPAGNVNFNGVKITSLADPTFSGDAATKNYVDNAIQGLDAKASCRVATTANIANLAAGAPNTLDGITLVQGDRVLVKDQSTASQNGIYTVTTLGTGANGVWTRAFDADAWAELPSAYVWVEQGAVNTDSGWLCTVDAGGTLGTTNVTWVLFSSASALVAGLGLQKTGNKIDIGANPGSGITVNLDDIAVDNTVARYYSNQGTHSAGTVMTILQVDHGLHATQSLVVQVHDKATGLEELPDIAINTGGDVTITYAVAFAANSKRVCIIG
jgi:hypothetical protein